MTMSFQEACDTVCAPGTRFEIQEVDVFGVPTKVFAGTPSNMRYLFAAAAARTDDFIVFEDERWPMPRVTELIGQIGHALVNDLGVTKGDRVAIAMRNYPEWVVAYWATLSIGAAAVGMNAWWTSQEMAFGLGDSRPKVLIADDERIERVLPLLDELRAESPLHVIAVRSDRELPADTSRWADVVDPGTAPDGLPAAEIDPDDDATIF